MRNLMRIIFVLAFFPVLGSRPAFSFAVVSGTSQATQAGVEILRAGGNAVDAMVAASFALNVTQPYNMGMGGGGFFLLAAPGVKGGPVVLEHREEAPVSAHKKMFLAPDGKPIPAFPERMTGPNPVGIPGTVAGLYQAHKKHGKLKWARLLAPAIILARQGFPISRAFEHVLDEEWQRISKFPDTARVFGDGQGKPLRMGRLLMQPELGQTLEAIAQGGGEAFYTGGLADKWLTSAQGLGVKFVKDDLRAYRVRVKNPVEFEVFGHRFFAPDAPSGGSLLVAGALRFLEQYYRSHPVPASDSPERVVVTSEAIRFYQALRDQKVADGIVGVFAFFGSGAEKDAWREISQRIEGRFKFLNAGAARSAGSASGSTEKTGHTAHLSVVDDRGMAVSYTTTIEEHFGSGLVVPGFGFLLNNELSDFSPDPENINAPAPGKRPRSNMSPLLVYKGTRLVGVLGCAGGSRIPTTLVQILENLMMFQMSAQAASAFPRIHPALVDGREVLEVEPAFGEGTMAALKKLGLTVQVVPLSTTAQVLFRRKGWEAAAESRSDGMGIVVE
ncbi:gamma-glutamyltransferase family protein [Bdellovibrionota bacterium FG-2]